jgi:hypothetical protein
MASRGATVTMVSAGVALIGVILFGISMGTMFDDIGEDTDELIFSGTQGDVNLTIDNTYAVFASSNVNCNSVNVTINDGNFEYYSKNCESIESKSNLVYIGSADISSSGTYSVEASDEIRIYEQIKEDYDGMGTSFVFMFIAEGVCCLSFIGLIVGIVLLIVDRDKNQNIVVIPSSQGTVMQTNQQYQQPPQM